MKVLLIILALELVACGSGKTVTPVSFNATLPGGGDVTSPAAPQTVNLTYYKLARATTPNINGHPIQGPITMNAMVVQYLGKTYVWDDGPQGYADAIANGIHYGPLYESYWMIGMVSQSGNLVIANCGTQCQQDIFTQPTVTDATSLNWFSQWNSVSGQTNVNTVGSTGTPVSVSCTLTGQSLNCVDFSINLAQAPM